MKPLPKQYDPKEAEPRLQRQWEASGVHAFADDSPREQTFVIDTPPPTVSGILHMGHIFSYTQADFVARYQRMSGKDVFYPMGFDDNGLPTERLVEKEKKIRGNAMPREEFVAICREVVKGAEDEFRDLFKSVALSVDWSREYHTISDEVRKLSQESFLDLLQKGQAYPDFRPTYWDWVDQTAIAQAEIENKEMPGVMNEILFTLEDGMPLHIATTRPELLGACVAVMYHPEDPNAAKYEGKTAITPVFGVKVPMIADELVERDKGTGLVMCCTFGDDTDKEWWRRHGLPCRNLLGGDGRIAINTIPMGGDTDMVVIRFPGGSDGTNDKSTLSPSNLNCVDFQKTSKAFEDTYWDVSESIEVRRDVKIKRAKEKIIPLLEAADVLLKPTPIIHTVKCAERSGTPIEIIPTYQWFVRVTDKKEALLAKGSECNWYPEFMQIRLNQWIEGLKEDWCISRQRFFGVPFPVWYAQQKIVSGMHFTPVIFARPEKLPVDPLNAVPDEFRIIEKIIDGNKFHFHCEVVKDYIDPISNEKFFSSGDIVNLIPDRNVMDTWATSSISPQINAKSLTPNKLFPADLRPQAHEIIRTWAFYTIVKAYLHADTIPWKNVMISGWCLAADKTKMSKSKGNVVTPVDLIREKGADVVRYWASTSRLGADTAFSEDLLKIGKKLVTKLWNATSFAAIHLSKIGDAPASAIDFANSNGVETLDKWILTRLHQTIAKATQEFERFEYCDARVAIEEFFWKDFCDNYLELVKGRAYGEIGDPQAHGSAHLTLYYCLDAILRLFAPFVPHVTEELFSHLFPDSGSVHARGTWPKAEEYPVDEEAIECGNFCTGYLDQVRKKKSENNVSIKFPVKRLVLVEQARKYVEPLINDLKSAGNIAEVEFVSSLPDENVEKSGLYNYAIELGEQADVA